MSRATNASRPTAVVFAYHNVGVRCLKVLLAHDFDVRLIVTHRDDPAETPWFKSVAAIGAENALPTINPEDPNTAQLIARVKALQADFLFSFYYRRMLKPALLATVARGALNMHGSLLPQYRGRAPVNWAVLNGERTTGATLHYMTAKPDEGDVVAQVAVPILPDDTAQDVFDKVTVAAEIALDGALPGLINGTASRTPQDQSRGNYCGGRTPADGIIDWRADAGTIHNLIRAVAPPFPGAFTTVGDVPARVLRARIFDSHSAPTLAPTLAVSGDRLLAHCGGGGALQVLHLELDGVSADITAVKTRFGLSPALLGDGRG